MLLAIIVLVQVLELVLVAPVCIWTPTPTSPHSNTHPTILCFIGFVSGFCLKICGDALDTFASTRAFRSLPHSHHRPNIDLNIGQKEGHQGGQPRCPQYSHIVPYCPCCNHAPMLLVEPRVGDQAEALESFYLCFDSPPPPNEKNQKTKTNKKHRTRKGRGNKILFYN